MKWPWQQRRKRVSPSEAYYRTLKARYDSAQTTDDNRRHWANADALSAEAAGSTVTRTTMRNRARYEVANGCYAQGIILTLANDVIGTGPRLQMLSEDHHANSIIEQHFSAWCKMTRLAEKLRTMRIAKAQDGEAFAIMQSNENLAGEVKLDIRQIEADQVTTPDLNLINVKDATDGIVFDQYGNPKTYHVLKYHPGGVIPTNILEYDKIAAASMIHWFRVDRAGQVRGISELAPSLELFAQLRQYAQATLDAAKMAALMPVVMRTSLPPENVAAAGPDGAGWFGEELELPRNMMVFAPEGWEPYQMKMEQPSTTYDNYYQSRVAEAARPWSMAKNVALGDSSGYNYASGRLDHQTYFKAIKVERTQCEINVLDRIFEAWLAEAARVYNFSTIDGHEHSWFWDGWEHVDPAKDETAKDKRLGNGTATYASEYAKTGKDWEREFEQGAREYGITVEEYKAMLLAKNLGVKSSAEPAPDESDKPDDLGENETDDQEKK